MDVIVHVIHRDKFTVGYIEFMKVCFPEYEQHFFTPASDSELQLFNSDNVHYIKSAIGISHYINLFRSCSKIIISGIFFSWKLELLFILFGFAPKTYLHFWGGDFYGYRYPYSFRHPKASLRKFIQHQLIKKCKGTINLIEADIEKLCAIFPNNAKHFTAPMKGSPLRKRDFNAIRCQPRINSAFRILVGNSATEENQHCMTFYALEHLKNENIEIICPLSYGSFDYREKIISKGKKIFGNKFVPITDFMNLDDYISLLASCDVGIFNNNRQQGMGNISILLRLGKKVYIREDTSMWHHYKKNMKYFVYPVSELKEISLEDFVRFSSEQAYNNIKIADEYALGNQAIEQWRKVLED